MRTYFPNHLTIAELEDVTEYIETIRKLHPECKDDFVLVDEIEGDIIVSFLREDAVLAYAKDCNIEPFDVAMQYMRENNKKIKNENKECWSVN